MNPNSPSLLFILVVLCCISILHAQIVRSNFTMCSPLDTTSFLKYVDLSLADREQDNRIMNNPPRLNDRLLMESTISRGNPCPFREKVLQKMSRNETIRVVVVGGSETHGTGIPLDQKVNWRWSTLLSNYLNTGWYSGSFKVINIAEGGWGIDFWVNHIHLITVQQPDLLLLDFTLNDFGLNHFYLITRYKNFIRLLESTDNPPASLFLGLFRLGFNIPERRTQPDFIPFVNCTKFAGQLSLWNLSHSCEETANSFNIPFGSFRNVIYPDYYLPPDNLIDVWTDHLHPNEVTHTYISHYMMNFFILSLKEALNTQACNKHQSSLTSPISADSTSFQNQEVDLCNRQGYIDPSAYTNARPICSPDNIKSNMSASRNESSVDSFKMSSTFNQTSSFWRYYADSKSKYGWIYHEQHVFNETLLVRDSKKRASFHPNVRMHDIDPRDLLSFEIEATEAVHLTYLQSYIGEMAAMMIWFDDDLKHAVYLPTMWLTPVSIPVVQTMLLKKLDLHPQLVHQAKKLFHLKPGKHILHILPVKHIRTIIMPYFKLKILEVISC